MYVYDRTSKGRFAKGNMGGPGRPRSRDEVTQTFVKQMERLIESPERFTAKQRKLLVNLLTSFMNGSDELAIAAASILVRMDGHTLKLVSESLAAI